MWVVVKLFRTFLWWLKCLWEGKRVPRVLPGALYSRSYMRKAWRDRLREIDRKVNDLRLRSSQTYRGGITERMVLLFDRRLMIAKRRAYRFD